MQRLRRAHRTWMIKPYCTPTTTSSLSVARAVQRAIQATTGFSSTDRSQHPKNLPFSFLSLSLSFMHSIYNPCQDKEWREEYRIRKQLLIQYRACNESCPSTLLTFKQSFPHLLHLISIEHLFSVSYVLRALTFFYSTHM